MNRRSLRFGRRTAVRLPHLLIVAVVLVTLVAIGPKGRLAVYRLWDVWDETSGRPPESLAEGLLLVQKKIESEHWLKKAWGKTPEPVDPWPESERGECKA